MPQMGVSVEEGTVLAWAVHAGELVESGQTICEIATDKVETDVPAPAAGVVSELFVDVGETVSVGTVLATIDPRDATRSRRGHSPVVLRVAGEHDVDLGQVVGTGRNGRITKRDVLAFVDTREAAVAPAEPSRMRQTIAERMTHSLRTAAHCHTFIEVEMSRVQAARTALGISPLPILARACTDALRRHPVLNARFDGDRPVSVDAVNIGIAVSLGDDGLIVPVIHDAHELSVEGLAERIGDLAGRARSRRLEPTEVQDGTFTITNLGPFGTLMSTPIINQPQVAILDVQAIVNRAVVVDDAIAIRPMTILGLGWDHRAMDGAQAAGFLATLRDTLQTWPTPVP